MNINDISALIKVLDCTQLQIKTAQDLLRFKKEYNVQNNKQLLQAIVAHRINVDFC